MFLNFNLFRSKYRKTSRNKPRGLYFSKALFEGLIFERAYIRRGLHTRENCVSKSAIGLILGRKFASQNRLDLLIVGRKCMSVICRKVLLKLALRT